MSESIVILAHRQMSISFDQVFRFNFSNFNRSSPEAKNLSQFNKFGENDAEAEESKKEIKNICRIPQQLLLSGNVRSFVGLIIIYDYTE